MIIDLVAYRQTNAFDDDSSQYLAPKIGRQYAAKNLLETPVLGGTNEHTIKNVTPIMDNV